MDFGNLQSLGKMLKSQEEPLADEKDKLSGISDCTIDELEIYFDDIISNIQVN